MHVDIIPTMSLETANLMVGLLRFGDMGSKFSLLVAKGCLFLSLNSRAVHDHHYRFVSRLFTISAAAGRCFILLALLRSKLFSAFTTSAN